MLSWEYEWQLRDEILESPFDFLAYALYGDPTPESITTFAEYQTSVGRADIVIAWPRKVVVMECKRGCADESAIAQVLRYCGAIEHVACRKSIAVVAAASFTRGALSAAYASTVICLAVPPDSNRIVEMNAQFPWDDESHDPLCRVVNPELFLNEG